MQSAIGFGSRGEKIMKLYKKITVLGSAIALSAIALGASTPLKIPKLQLKIGIRWHNPTNKWVDFEKYHILPQAEVTYSFNSHFYTSASIKMTGTNRLGWDGSAGLRYPTPIFTPYLEVGVTHNSHQNFFDSQGVEVEANGGISMRLPPTWFNRLDLTFSINNFLKKSKNYEVGIVKNWKKLFIETKLTYFTYPNSVDIDTNIGFKF